MAPEGKRPRSARARPPPRPRPAPINEEEDWDPEEIKNAMRMSLQTYRNEVPSRKRGPVPNDNPNQKTASVNNLQNGTARSKDARETDDTVVSNVTKRKRGRPRRSQNQGSNTKRTDDEVGVAEEAGPDGPQASSRPDRNEAAPEAAVEAESFSIRLPVEEPVPDVRPEAEPEPEADPEPVEDGRNELEEPTSVPEPQGELREEAPDATMVPEDTPNQSGERADAPPSAKEEEASDFAGPVAAAPEKRRRGRKSKSSKRKSTKDIVRAHFKIPTKLMTGDESMPEGEMVDLDPYDDEEELCADRSHSKEIASGSRIAFPSKDDPDAVDLHESDMGCLGEAEYLNDTVIDFYIKHMEVTAEHFKEQFHVFGSFFYTKLREVVCKHKSEPEQMTKLTKLRKWTRGVNIFDKRYLLLPIHDKQHWSLGVVCFLGPNVDSYAPCCLLHLDSMKTGHTSVVVYEVLRRYLNLEWNLHHSDAKAPLKKNVYVRKVKVPQQDNGYDCGLFLLHFIENFLAKAPETFDIELVKDMFEWFKGTEASELRIIIKQLIERQFRTLRAGQTLKPEEQAVDLTAQRIDLDEKTHENEEGQKHENEESSENKRKRGGEKEKSDEIQSKDEETTSEVLEISGPNKRKVKRRGC